MITNLTISFEYDGINYIRPVLTDYVGENYDNTPYNLAAAFVEVIKKKSDTNEKLVFEELRNEFFPGNDNN